MQPIKICRIQLKLFLEGNIYPKLILEKKKLRSYKKLGENNNI